MSRFRRRYDEVQDARARDDVRVREFGPSKTQQSHAIDCDLNVILKRFGVLKDGKIPLVPYPPEMYGEELDVDLREALEIVRDAQAHFAALPSNLRARFEHSPQKLWEFVNNPANAEECVKLGFLKRNTPLKPEAKNAESGSVSA